MALLGTYIDQRTHAVINTNASASFAHGLPAAPDLVLVRETSSSASATNWVGIQPIFDATNVSLYNQGAANSKTLRVTSMVLHSVIR